MDRTMGSVCTIQQFMNYLVFLHGDWHIVGLCTVELLNVYELMNYPPMNWARGKVRHTQLNITHAWAFIHACTHKRAHTLSTVPRGTR